MKKPSDRAVGLTQAHGTETAAGSAWRMAMGEWTGMVAWFSVWSETVVVLDF